MKWLEKYGIENPNLIMIANKTKGDIVKELNLDAFIDDCKKYIDDIIQKSPNTKVFTMPWNYCLYSEKAMAVNNPLEMIYYMENNDKYYADYKKYLSTKSGRIKRYIARKLFKIGFFFYDLPLKSIPIKHKNYYLAYGAYYDFEKDKYHPDKSVPSEHCEIENYMLIDILPSFLIDCTYKISDLINVLCGKFYPYEDFMCDGNCKTECKKDSEDGYCPMEYISMPNLRRFPDYEDLQETKVFCKHRHPGLYKLWDILTIDAKFELDKIKEIAEEQIYYNDYEKKDIDKNIDYKIFEGYEYCKNELNNPNRSEDDKKSIQKYIHLYEKSILKERENIIKKYKIK